MIKPRAQRLLEEIRNNRDSVVQLHRDSMIALSKSGILDLLRAWSRPQFFKLGQDTGALAAHGAYSAGYSQCLDDLMEFQEFLKDEKAEFKLPMDFGSVASLLKQGSINEKEADELRRTAARTGTS